MMDFNEGLKNMILDGKSAIDVENYALSKGMINLERDGVFKVIEWLSTLEEVYRYVKTRFDK